jgi:isoleucyl-tRNA synthetase
VKLPKRIRNYKEDIGKTISIEEYNEACKKTVMRYTDVE